MLPQIEKYFADIKTAEDEYDKTCATAATELRAAPESGYNTIASRIYDATVEHAQNIKEIKIDGTWEALKKDQDPAVAWIAIHCAGYKEHADEVLRILPATVDQLRQFRTNKGWCSDYTNFLERAIDDGVLGPADPNRLRESLTSWFRNNFSSHRPYAEELERRVAAIVKAELEAAHKVWSEEQALTAQATDAENAAADAVVPPEDDSE